jgi:hypothetical protein
MFCKLSQIYIGNKTQYLNLTCLWITKTIYNNQTLNEILRQVQGLIKPEIVERPSTEWKFVRYLHYEIAIFRLQSTIGYAVSLPLHFYEDSDKKTVIKSENLKDNLCF